MKRFLKLPRNFRTDVLFQILPLDFKVWLKLENSNNLVKWEARKLRKKVPGDELHCYSFLLKDCLPVEFSYILRRFTAICRVCRVPFYPEHLLMHGVSGISVKEIRQELRNLSQKLLMEKEEKSGNKKVRLSREEILSVNSNFLKSKIKEIDLVLEEYAEKF